MNDNFSGRYWILKREEHRELSEALRKAEQRERRAQRERERRKMRKTTATKNEHK